MASVLIAGEYVPYVIVRKAIKNTYLRIRSDGSLIITARTGIDAVHIEAFIGRNADKIRKARNILKDKIVLRDGEMLLWGQVVTKPNGWDERRYRQETVAKAALLLRSLTATLGRDIDLSGIALRSRLMKTRFGSCNVATKAINLNSILARYEDRFLAAILVHEIVHLAHPDHGKGFYATLLLHVPDYRKIRKELGEAFRRTEV
ncbi:MAG: SprT-like domain-containing protein [bacterium]